MGPTTYFAKGCFLEGTLIGTPNGDVPVETLKAGDKVISFNETTKQQEEAVVGDLDVLKKDHYYILNGIIKVTAEHPFYTKDGQKEVKDLNIGDVLVGRYDEAIKLETIKVVYEEVTVYNPLDVTPNHNYYAGNFLVHNKGCFLPDMRVVTPTGTKKIKDIRPTDTVMSFNEKNQSTEYAKVSSVQIFDVEGYYTINDTLKVTAEHPLYIAKTVDDWFNKKKSSIVEVKDVKIGDHLLLGAGHMQEIRKIEYTDKKVTVYNLINVVPNHNYFVGDKLNQYIVHNKGGGSCFLRDTQIQLVNGTKPIQDIRAGDRIMSYNERTGRQEPAQVAQLDILQADSYFIINDKVRVTGEHPFYVADDNGNLSIKLVKDLQENDKLVLDNGMAELVDTIEEIEEGGVTVYNLINVRPNNNYYANGYLVHNKGGGGGRSSSSHSSSSSKSSSKSSSNSSKSSSTPSKPKTGTSTAKPGAKVKDTKTGKEVTSSTKAPTKKEYSKSSGVVGDNGYTPRFTNGYTAPAGSVVYQRDTGFIDYLPWIYIFGQSNAAPQNQTATIVQPDGKEVIAKPEPGGTDGLLILNWILLIIIVSAVVGGIIWLINKLTSR